MPDRCAFPHARGRAGSRAGRGVVNGQGSGKRVDPGPRSQPRLPKLDFPTIWREFGGKSTSGRSASRRPPQRMRRRASAMIRYAAVPRGSFWRFACDCNSLSSSLLSIATTRLMRACLDGPVPVPGGRPAPRRRPPHPAFLAAFFRVRFFLEDFLLVAMSCTHVLGVARCGALEQIRSAPMDPFTQYCA